MSAILAGFMIGFAALLSCCFDNSYISALFFSIGLLYIRLSKLYLYTGQIQNIKNKTTTWKELGNGFLSNIVGVGIVLLFAIPIFAERPIVYDNFLHVIYTKWNYPIYYFLFSGACCGILMTIATKKESPLWLSILCVMAFILGGFNHSIADWFYIGSEPINFLKWFLVICGNFIGGYLVATK